MSDKYVGPRDYCAAALLAMSVGDAFRDLDPMERREAMNIAINSVEKCWIAVLDDPLRAAATRGELRKIVLEMLGQFDLLNPFPRLEMAKRLAKTNLVQFDDPQLRVVQDRLLLEGLALGPASREVPYLLEQTMAMEDDPDYWQFDKAPSEIQRQVIVRAIERANNLDKDGKVMLRLRALLARPEDKLTDAVFITAMRAMRLWQMIPFKTADDEAGKAVQARMLNLLPKLG